MQRRILSKSVIFFIIFLMATEMPYAAPIIYRQQRMKAMQQQQEQEEYEQYYLHQQGQQQGAQAQGQQAATQETYQQKIDERNQAIAQAIQEAHNQAVSSGNPQTNNNNQVQQQSLAGGMAQQHSVAQSGSSEAQDVVDLSEVWKKLDHKSTIWTALIDDQSKLLTVSEYIDRFQNEGVKIQAPPEHYVQMIDQVVGQNPAMLERPFGELLQILAIIDYDFDNGMDKDVLAKKVLGEAGYESNKKRLTQAQQQQQPSPGGQAGQ